MFKNKIIIIATLIHNEPLYPSYYLLKNKYNSKGVLTLKSSIGNFWGHLYRLMLALDTFGF